MWKPLYLHRNLRKDAGVVDRDGLENRCTGNRTEGSNPSLSANKGVNQQVMRFAPFIMPKKFLGISTAPPLFLHSTRVLLLTLKKRQRLPPGAAVVVIEMK